MTAVEVQGLLKAFKGMFPQEIVAVCTSHEKYFGYILTEGRTRFLVNSFESQGLYTKVPINNEFLQLAEKFAKTKLCFYVYPKSVVHGDLNYAHTELTRPIETEAVPQWLNPKSTLMFLEGIEDLYWVWRYKRLKFQWMVFDVEDRHARGVEGVPLLLKSSRLCERQQALAVCNYLVETGQLTKPVDPDD